MPSIYSFVGEMDLNIPGVSSRRSACDRCRGQKLRCLREQADQQSCDRCVRADAECRTSPVFRVRSYAGDTAFGSTNSVGEKEREQKRVRIRHANAPQQQSQRKPPVITPQTSHELDTVAFPETMHPTTCFEETTSMTLFGTSPPSSTRAMYSEDFSISNTMNGMHWEAEDPLFHDMILPDAMDDTLDLFGSTDSSLENSRSQASMFVQDLASQPGLPSISSPQKPTSAFTSDLNNTECSSNNILAMQAESTIICKSLENQATGSIIVDKMAEKSYSQRLAKINLDFISLLSLIDGTGSSTEIVEMLVEPVDEFVSPRTRSDDILNSTRDFLEILSVIARSSTTSSPTNSLHSSTSNPLSTSDVQTCPKLDFASLLLILTSYINMLQLYVVLFSHVHGFLKEISDSDDPSLCPLPGLSFCSFPLRKPHNPT
ncbi:hypothetical protein NHQ30_010600 [Ciborinia camelliae]|nr:hypothetical protein NHQ30_010600 [Ciborinia camelliae]